MEFHVNAVVATVPSVGVLHVHAQGLFGRGQVEEFLNIRKVIAQGRFGTLDTNIIGIQTGSLVGRGERRVARDKGRLAGKAVDGTVSTVALMNQLGASRNGLFHGLIFRIIKDLDAM